MNNSRRFPFLRRDHVKICTIILVLILPFVSLRAIGSRTHATSRSREVVMTTQQQAGQKVFRSAQPATIITPHVLAASYYSVRKTLDATLLLSNQGSRPFEIQATLFNVSGDRFDAPPVMLEGNKARSFDLASWTDLAGTTFREGSLQVRYDGKEMELGGVLQLVDPEHSLIFDEELSEPMMFASSRLEGVWWLPSNKCGMSLAVSNTTDSPVSVLVKFDGLGTHKRGTETIALRDHETRLMDLNQLAEKQHGSISETGGIDIQYSGPKGAVLARGLIQDPSSGYSNVVEFVDPQTVKSSKLDGSGLHTADIRKEELQQVVVAHNFSDSPTTLTGRVSITQPDGQTSFVSLRPVALDSGETKSISLNGVIDREASRHATATGLEFQYSSAPGSVVMSAQSVSKSGNQVFRVPMVDANSVASSTGQYPWSLEGNSSTFVYLKNTTDKPQQYHLQINFGDDVYSSGLKTIEPGQPIAFDLRALRDEQVPDAKGRKIPLNAVRGQVHWSIYGDEHLGLIGRVEQFDVAKGISMTAACTECCPDSWYSFWIDPLNGAAVPGDTGQFSAMQQNITCYNEVLDPFQVFPNNFTSSDPSVASCNSTGFATALYPGTTDIGAHWTVRFWDFDFGSGGCTRYLETANPEAVCNVHPKITGPNSMWWFHGENPSGYSTQITLTTTSGAISYSWSVVSGGSKVSLTDNGDGSATIVSTGASDNMNDVGIQVSVDGFASDQFNLTVKAPYLLHGKNASHSADQTWGYFTQISYAIWDQFTTQLPSDVPATEQWTTVVVDDYAGNNWLQANEGGGNAPGGVLTDYIQGQNITRTPTRLVPQSPLLNVPVHHWGQDLFVGSLTPGAGRRVQSDNQQKYTDHADHTNITSPNPN